jgi:hypothetical protein
VDNCTKAMLRTEKEQRGMECNKTIVPKCNDGL